MQAAPQRANPVVPYMTAPLRAVEAVLLRRGQEIARRNAWSAVLEDRRRAHDRREAQYVLEAVSTPGSRAT